MERNYRCSALNRDLVSVVSMPSFREISYFPLPVMVSVPFSYFYNLFPGSAAHDEVTGESFALYTGL